jgi:hypothetical protein
MRRLIPSTTTAALAGLVFGMGVGLSFACGNGTGDLRVKITCESYCERAHECNDDVDENECVDDCRDTIDDCMADEAEQTLDDLDSCSAEECDEFGGCTIGAGLQCAFGV